jgi:hypothetical protein
MADTGNFANLVPGFDFLQNLVKGAGAALPNIGQWVAPTLNPEEIEKRIDELKTVQFWLEQNSRMISATIQALEVQRMTLSTLQTMNVQMGDLREAMKIRMPDLKPTPAAPPPAPEELKAAPEEAEPAAKAPSIGIVDPMQWWGALTKQFTELAATAMKDGASDVTKNLAGNMVQQSFDAAAETLRNAVAAPAAVVRSMAEASTAKSTPAAKKKPAAKSARAAKTSRSTAASRKP